MLLRHRALLMTSWLGLLLVVNYVSHVTTSVLLPKCCPHQMVHHVTDDEGLSCVATDDFSQFNWNLSFYQDTELESYDIHANMTPSCHLLHLEPNKYPGDLAHLLSNGSLFVPGHVMGDSSSLREGVYLPEEYCLEHILTSESLSRLPEALVCFRTRDYDEKGDVATTGVFGGRHRQSGARVAGGVAYACGAAFSDACLLLTMVAFLLLPDMRNLYGKSLLAHVASLFFAYFAYCLALLWGHLLPPLPCHLLGVALHFFFLSAFCWLTLMCWDMWWKFRKQLPAKSGRKDGRQFFIYCLLGWGGPFLFILASVLLNYAPGVPSDVIKPGYGEESCWIVGRQKESLVYFYGPVSLLLLCNLFFFAMTSRTIRRAQRDSSEVWKNPENGCHTPSAHKAHRKRVLLYLKLFVVMGLCWIAEVLSWLLQMAVGVPAYFFYPSDLLNCLQGVLICLVSVGKKKTLRRLWDKVRQRFPVIMAKPSIVRHRMTRLNTHTSSPSISIHSRSTVMSLASNGSVRK